MSNYSAFDAVAVVPCYRDYQEENKTLLPLQVKVREIDAQGERAQLKRLLADVDLVFLRDVQLDGDILAHMKKCKGIVRYGVGVDNIDLEAAKSQQIMVANVPDYGAEIEVSDHAAALTLALLRRVPARHIKVAHKGLWRIDQSEPMHRIGQKTLGLIGFGKIAQAYLTRLRAFGVHNVFVYDPYASDQLCHELGVQKVPLETLCKNANLISIHAPSTPESHHLINAKTLTLMQADTAIINTARGALIDEVALVDALLNNKIFGVALDVQEKEPMPEDSPLHALKNLENVILTNHVGWYSEESVATLQRKAGEQAFQILSGGAPTHWVNPF